MARKAELLRQQTRTQKADVKVLFGAGVNELPLNLSNVTAGVSLTIQAAALGQGTLHLSDAQVLQTWSCDQWCISW